MVDQIHPMSTTLFAELLHGADPEQDLHLLLWSPGGDAEVAVRLVRMAQDACRRFTVVVPDIAKSAATVLCLGAHEIVMGPTSDLGPIDPQVYVPDRGYVGAKDLIAAIDRALDDVANRPATYPIHAAMLAGMDETVFQFAKSALAGTTDIVKKALASQPDRSQEDQAALLETIRQSLVDTPNMHSAVIGSDEARAVGLPVTALTQADERWQGIWGLWTRYFALNDQPFLLQVYESAQASQIAIRRPGPG
jgi:hypothetical protein